MAVDPVTLAHESATSDAFERGALALLKREVGFDVAFFSIKSEEARPTVVGLDEATIARAVSSGSAYASELLPVKHAALAARGVAVDTEVLGLRGVERSRYHREVAARVGGRHSLMAYLRWRGAVFGAIMLGRAGPGFAQHELRRVEALLPGLSLGRAAFGLPWSSEPLTTQARPGLLSKLGLARTQLLASLPTAEGALVVRDRAGFREMVAITGNSELIWTRAKLSEPSRSGWEYVDLFHVAAALAARRQRALFIGCGGAVALRQFAGVYPGLAMDLVECDPAVIALARKFYALDDIPGLSVHIADGAEFVKRAPSASFDVAIVDAYDASALVQPFAEPAFFAALRRSLSLGGAMGINVIASLGAAELRNISSAIRGSFAELRSLPVVTTDENHSLDSRRNVVLIAR
jgi:hypothetical protein